MKEFEQYRIELTGEEAETIVREHISKLLESKGYTLEYSCRADDQWFPETHWRGVKSPPA